MTKAVFGIPAGTCRFTPTCASYAAEAYRRYPPLRATVMTVWRVLRCHPWSRGGFDPVR